MRFMIEKFFLWILRYAVQGHELLGYPEITLDHFTIPMITRYMGVKARYIFSGRLEFKDGQYYLPKGSWEETWQKMLEAKNAGPV